MLFLEAVAHMEGYFEEGSRPQRNNNPGDLEYGPEAIRYGATSSDGRFAIFPSPEVGWEALRRWFSISSYIVNGQLLAGYLGATIGQAVFRFAPPNENNSDQYLDYVLHQTGLSASDLLAAALLEIPNASVNSK